MWTYIYNYEWINQMTVIIKQEVNGHLKIQFIRDVRCGIGNFSLIDNLDAFEKKSTSQIISFSSILITSLLSAWNYAALGGAVRRVLGLCL